MSGGRLREPVRFLVFSASLRRDSLNTKLAGLAATAIEANGGEVAVTSMRDFDGPSYDLDVQNEQGFPPGAEEFRRRLEACHGFVVASPEYNASMPGVPLRETSLGGIPGRAPRTSTRSRRVTPRPGQQPGPGHHPREPAVDRVLDHRDAMAAARSAAGGVVTRFDAALTQDGVQPLQLCPEPPGLVG